MLMSKKRRLGRGMSNCQYLGVGSARHITLKARQGGQCALTGRGERVERGALAWSLVAGERGPKSMWKGGPEGNEQAGKLKQVAFPFVPKFLREICRLAPAIPWLCEIFNN